MECNCEGWKIGQPQINTAWQNSVNHHGEEYNGPYYKYCPWCGKELQEEEKPIKIVIDKIFADGF